MLNLLTNAKTIAFLGGAVVGAVAKPVLTSKPVRNAAVCVLSKGYQIKNKAESHWSTIREEAEDLCAEAVIKAYSDNAKTQEGDENQEGDHSSEEKNANDFWDDV